jgi:O-succinylbenzoic acid--CoA ligase
MTRSQGEPEKGSVPDLLLWRSTISPDSLALKFGSVEWSYEEMQRKVSTLSAIFLSWGVKKGDRVGMLLNPSEIYIMAIHALVRIGAVIVPMNVRLSPSELLWQINDADLSLILYDQVLSDLKIRIDAENKRRVFRWKYSGELMADTTRRPVKDSKLDISSLHSIIYTSGSTGIPKGVKITLSNILWNAISFRLQYDASPSDRWLLVMPLFHVGGYMIPFRSVLGGSSIVIHPTFETEAVSESLDRDGITFISLVPTMLRRLLESRLVTFPASLRIVFLGGSPIPNFLISAIKERKLPVVLTYGMTETCSQAAISPVEVSTKPTKISYRPIFPTIIAVKCGRTLGSQTGKVGEILIRGPTVFGGYWRDLKTTLTVLKDGWLHTGDLGFLDAQGGIVVLGRRDEMIISGGENIYPVEVESSLLEHEAIEDAVVIAKEDPEWGQQVEAVVKIKQGFARPSPSELTEFLAEKIGGYKIPKVYHFWTSIPKTPTGKTKREIVREFVERGKIWKGFKEKTGEYT